MEIAKKIMNFSPADINNLINISSLIAIKKGKEIITDDDVD